MYERSLFRVVLIILAVPSIGFGQDPINPATVQFCKFSTVDSGIMEVSFQRFDLNDNFFPITKENIQTDANTITIRSDINSYFATQLISFLEMGCLEERWAQLNGNKIRARIQLGGKILYIDNSGTVSGGPFKPSMEFRMSDGTYYDIYHLLRRYVGTADITRPQMNTNKKYGSTP